MAESLSGVSERDRVDKALDAARGAIEQMGVGDFKAFAWVLFYLTEALMRQVRDLDDDVWHLKEALEKDLADLGIIINNGGSL